MADKKRALVPEGMLTLAEAKARVGTLKLPEAVDGKGGGGGVAEPKPAGKSSRKAGRR
jgi:hypothetical protein